jgi:hypothetical protein
MHPIARRRGAGAAALVALVLVLAPGPVTAAAAPAEAGDAEALVREGIVLRRSGDDQAALQRFERALAIEKTPRTLAQLAFAEQALGRWGAADRHLREASAADDAWIRKNRRPIDAALEVIGQHIGRLEIAGTPAGAEVRVDGELVGRLPLAGPIRVAAGSAVVELRAPGSFPAVREVVVRAQGIMRETFALQPLPSPARPDGVAEPGDRAGEKRVAAGGGASAGTPRSDARSGPARATAKDGFARVPSEPAAATLFEREPVSRRRLIALGGAAAAAAAAAFAIVEHLSWQDKVSSFGGMMACGSDLPGRGGAACERLYDDGIRARTLATVGYAGAAALGVGAAILYFTDPARGAGGGRALACAPAPAGSPGVHCRLRF